MKHDERFHMDFTFSRVFVHLLCVAVLLAEEANHEVAFLVRGERRRYDAVVARLQSVAPNHLSRVRVLR